MSVCFSPPNRAFQNGAYRAHTGARDRTFARTSDRSRRLADARFGRWRQRLMPLKRPCRSDGGTAKSGGERPFVKLPSMPEATTSTLRLFELRLLVHEEEIGPDQSGIC